MALQKQDVTFNFAQGVDTLTDENQLPLGKFVDMQNSTFIESEGYGMLNKRNGFDAIASFSGCSYVTTFKGSLLGIGNNVYAYSNSVTALAGYYQPLSLSVLPLNRNFNYPNVVDSARANNGFIAYVYRSLPYSAAIPTGFTSGQFYYSVVDGESGQQMIPPTPMPQPVTGSQVYPGRIFSFNNRFVLTFDGTIGSFAAANSSLNYFTIDHATLASTSPQLISTNYRNASSSSIQIAHDAAVAGNSLYVVFSGSSSQVLANTINSAFAAGASQVIASNSADMMSVAADTSSATTVFASWANYKGQTFKTIALDSSLASRWSAQTIIGSASLQVGSSSFVNIASGTRNGNLSVFVENGTFVAAGSLANTPFNSIVGASVTTQGSVSANGFTQPVQRQAGLASKCFTLASQVCFMSMYYGPNQSTYFLHGTSGTTCNVIGKMAYGNAYPQYNFPSTSNFALGLPSAQVIGSSAQIAFLQTISIQNVNKATGITGSSTSIYSTPGINVSTWNFGTEKTQAAEISGNLHMNGGYLWMYDGGKPCEHNFLLYPDKTRVTASAPGGGRIANGTYFYQIIYRWQDNQGNIHRSAPSVPLKATYISGSSDASGTVDVNVLGFTQRSPDNPVVIQCYRWGSSQQVYYKLPVDIVLSPGNFGTDLTGFADPYSDAEIAGNEILYTNGGIVEDIGLPAVSSIALFDTRLWGISAEDENVLFYGKPSAQSTPQEMSDLLTYYVPPNISGVPVPGGNKCIYGMDDKLIVFKKNAILYINGQGPDSTGAQNGYSNPILITNGVGCTRPNSIVLVPQGLIFQSDNGIWLLGRDLSVSYVGKGVDKFNDCEVRAAVSVPGTTEARFTLGSSGQTLVYDYLAEQWNQQTNVPGLSSCIYKSQQAIIDPIGAVSLQTATGFADNGVPTVMKWTTGWIGLAGLQGYQRAYDMYILGKFYSPHIYTVDIAYDYNPTILQTAVINPTNSVGSGSQVEQWEINFKKQQCQSFQLTFTEISSSTAGVGLSLSGVKLVYGAKKGYPGNIGVRNTTG